MSCAAEAFFDSAEQPGRMAHSASSSERDGDPHEDGPEKNHGASRPHGVASGEAPEGVARHEQQNDGDGVGDAQRGTGFRMTMNGIVTGNVERNTQRKTAKAPRPSSLLNPMRAGGSGSCFRRTRIDSSSAGSSTDATAGGNASAMSRYPHPGSVASRTARKVRRPWLFSARQPIR
jgi:hypothetical protein